MGIVGTRVRTATGASVCGELSTTARTGVAVVFGGPCSSACAAASLSNPAARSSDPAATSWIYGYATQLSASLFHGRFCPCNGVVQCVLSKGACCTVQQLHCLLPPDLLLTCVWCRLHALHGRCCYQPAQTAAVGLLNWVGACHCSVCAQCSACHVIQNHICSATMQNVMCRVSTQGYRGVCKLPQLIHSMFDQHTDAQPRSTGSMCLMVLQFGAAPPWPGKCYKSRPPLSPLTCCIAWQWLLDTSSSTLRHMY